MDILVYLLGGFLAGIATGMVGLSAAVIIAPLFATVIGFDPYVAIGIALAADIFASATSATNYIRYKNIDLHRALVMGLAVVLFTILGSYLSRDMDPRNLGGVLNGVVVFLGLRFLLFPVSGRGPDKLMNPSKMVLFQSLLWGAVIGMISGYFGSGGGLSMLAVLTMLLGYGLKEAVGTSVFIMTFTAFVGAVTHIVIGGTDWLALVLASIAAFVGANGASIFANRIQEKRLNQIIGGFLVIYGVVLIVLYFF
jgi:uncharacterized membrane protein YfcA